MIALVLLAGVDPDTRVATVRASAGEPVVHRASDAEETPVAGRRSADGHTLVTAGPLRAGETYVVTAGGERATFVVPAMQVGPPPSVRVLPDVAEVPVNHLKFYLHFSRPMRSGPHLFEALSLVDETAGAEVEIAFSEVANWDPDMRTLTLVLHPGRQKRQIGFSEGLGRVLVEGHTYTLRTAGLVAADGAALPEGPVHRFVATAPDVLGPAWTIEPPAGPRSPVVVHLDEPVEPRLAEQAFAVEGVETRAELLAGCRAVALHPVGAWPDAQPEVSRVGRLEDLAGNTPERPFDARR